MATRKTVYCKFTVEGIHNWEGCPHEEVAYLRDPHRHVFHFKAYADVTHSDRDIEFIMMKHLLQDYIVTQYYDSRLKCCVFGSMSCEMIGEELLDRFDFLHTIDISEDNENGGIVTRLPL